MSSAVQGTKHQNLLLQNAAGRSAIKSAPVTNCCVLLGRRVAFGLFIVGAVLYSRGDYIMKNVALPKPKMLQHKGPLDVAAAARAGAAADPMT